MRLNQLIYAMKKKLLLFMLTAFAGSSYAQASSEGFEAWPPQGWSVNQNAFGTLNAWQQTDPAEPDEPPYEGNHAAIIKSSNVPAGSVAIDWLVSPAMNITSELSLRFYSRFTMPGDQGGVFKIAICPAGADASDLTTFMVIQAWSEIELNPLQLEYMQVNVQFPPGVENQPYRIAFLAEGNDGDTWLIDNVSIGQTCFMPVELNAINITSSSATLGWSSFNAQQWEVEVLPLADAPTGIGVLVNTPSYEATNLDNGDYKFYVRTRCSEDAYSTWAGPFFFSISNGITGIVRFDSDNDSDCDDDDIGVPSVEIEITAGTETYTVYTNGNGGYAFYGLPDDITSATLQVVAPNGFDAITPVTVPLDFTSNPVVQIDHCLGQADPIHDLSVLIIPIGVARPGLPANYDIVVRNMGTTAVANATVVFTFDDVRLDFLSAGGTHTVSGNTVTFTLTNLQPFSFHHLSASFTVMTPPVNIGGEILVYNASITPVQDDATQIDNTNILNQTIVNSYDPNDITVHEGATIYEDETGNYLHYTIRFQNMGTAEAIDIRVENLLDANLDWSTFEPIASSHSYTAERDNDEIQFYFEGINLPHEAANEPASHGFISYRIKPKPTFELGDIAYNNAGIFFDFNPAIVTNIVSTEVIEEPTAGVIDIATQGVAIYPNPVKNRFTVQTPNETVSLIEVYDVNGRLCLSQANASTVNAESLNNGLYFVKITTENGMTTKKIVKQ